ncbi:MAG: hypothetical protein ABIP97_13845 [Chthoniobacterales bacterium]
MSFEKMERWAAFSPDLFENLPALISAYGSNAKDGHEIFDTLLAFYDDTSRTRIRAAWYDPSNPQDNTLVPTVLSDGRVAVYGLWSNAIVAAWQSGEIEAEEFTAEQVRQLCVQEEL